MFNYREWNKVNRLIKDGNQFLSTGALSIENSHLRIWLAAVGDTVLPRLPAESSKLRIEFEELLKTIQVEKKNKSKNENLGEDKIIKQEKLKDKVSSVIRILEYTRGLPEPNKTSSRELHESKSTSYERLSGYKNPPEINETEHKGLEHEIRYYISEHYFHSWWFRIPIIILGISVAFAILGVIQINSFKISVQEISDSAVERAKQDINAEVDTIRNDLETYASGEEEKISSDTVRYREELNQQKTQATQALNEMTTKLTDLNPEVTSLEKRQKTLENRIVPLEEAFEVIAQDTKRGLWFDAVAILNNSLVVISVTFIISCVALIGSLVSFWRSRRR